ncbi:hypothetical protein SCHPADRAFT_894311 [Schizopora paradoxa]|uniref:Uncharacterized protein n=1 Tax=Schizopora paradoxa TaxID=27342 RepID=A0A0H2R8Z4_9AGAM|nr:hypothetical protein SCHPADRAFT_894311 [Schizopora paradoxa]
MRRGYRKTTAIVKPTGDGRVRSRGMVIWRVDVSGWVVSRRRRLEEEDGWMREESCEVENAAASFGGAGLMGPLMGPPSSVSRLRLPPSVRDGHDGKTCTYTRPPCVRRPPVIEERRVVWKRGDKGTVPFRRQRARMARSLVQKRMRKAEATHEMKSNALPRIASTQSSCWVRRRAQAKTLPTPSPPATFSSSSFPRAVASVNLVRSSALRSGGDERTRDEWMDSEVRLASPVKNPEDVLNDPWD